ncbi:sigma factor-like helix-turn-helix DNA-binding protein [Streptomyces arboris]|uniref:RNA polymerase sigma factor 70 region 4 type 2 domain-containing protein n=1 Tax=Streptomyces arboris TaxID=2600619 RepID=A0A5N5ESW8_9ACTN|nr:hypothetical protein F5983_02885 [Streptomyces arboris]
MRPPSLRGHLTLRAPLRYGLVPRDPLRPPATRPSPDASAAVARRCEGLRRLIRSPVAANPDVGAGAVERVHMASSLSELPDRKREVLFLAYYLDLTQPEVARLLDLPLGTVKSHTRRGLRALACLLDEHA